MAALASMLTFSLVIFPKDALQAALDGLKIFWEIVFPSLLPFFVLSEILLGLGVVHCLGVFLEPMMRPVFNVPGAGAFAMSMGLAAGYPMDAVITGKFRRKGLCTRVEGERLLAFTNTADPLFIFGAVAVGMFGLPELGAILAVAHYLSSFSVGFLFRFYRRHESTSRDADSRRPHGILRRALRALIAGRREDGRSFGQLIGDAVRESVSTLLMIGGFIMFFSVLVRILTVIGFMRRITPLIAAILRPLGVSATLVPAFLSGFLEIDLGTAAAGRAAAPLIERAVAASAIVAWSGLCVHGQVASVLHGTDIRMGPYFLARFCHAVLAGAYTFALFALVPVPVSRALPAWKGMVLGARFVLRFWQLLVFYGGLALIALLVSLCRYFQLAISIKTGSRRAANRDREARSW